MRSDGRAVVFCVDCGMGALHPVPDDLASIYFGDYYAAADGSAVGYHDYETTAEHGVAWAAAIVQALGIEGAILDIGCANGHLLRKLCPPLQAFGIEMSPGAAEAARAAGATVIGADLLDAAAMTPHAGAFDIVTSIATFEHLSDFRGGVERARTLMKEDGILLFEVPLISATRDNTTWYTSSLEHAFYPTVPAIERLFDDLAMPLAGTEIWVVGYASTYIGIASRNETTLARHRPAWERIVDLSRTPQNAPERRAAALLHVIHAAHRDPGAVECLSDLIDADLNRALLKRIAALWREDARLAGVPSGAATLG